MSTEPSPRPPRARPLPAGVAPGRRDLPNLARPAVLWLALIAGCRAPERGVTAAERDLARGDLTAALLELDSVIPADPDYARARSLAAAVERRMRSAQRFLGQGLALRAEWRDDEALAAFEASLEVWPGLDGVEELIAATRVRCSALGPREDSGEEAPAQPAPGFVATTRPVDLPGRGAAPAVEVEPNPEPTSGEVDPEDRRSRAVPGLEPSGGSTELVSGPPVVTARSGDAGPEPGPRPTTGPDRLDEAARGALDGVRSQLRSGDVERALEGLEVLRAGHPQSLEVSGMLSQVLHQKALLHYGQGDLGVAIETWERLLSDDPGHDGARAFLRAARTELGDSR